MLHRGAACVAPLRLWHSLHEGFRKENSVYVRSGVGPRRREGRDHRTVIDLGLNDDPQHDRLR